MDDTEDPTENLEFMAASGIDFAKQMAMLENRSGPVHELRQKLFHASHSDDWRDRESSETITAWAQQYGKIVLPSDAAEHLIRHFFETKGWTPEQTSQQSVEGLAALIGCERDEGMPPTAIVAALAGKPKVAPLFNLLWKSLDQFVDWDTIGQEVWGQEKAMIEPMTKAVQRLDSVLLETQSGEYGAEGFVNSGARVYRRTNKGQN